MSSEKNNSSIKQSNVKLLDQFEIGSICTRDKIGDLTADQAAEKILEVLQNDKKLENSGTRDVLKETLEGRGFEAREIQEIFNEIDMKMGRPELVKDLGPEEKRRSRSMSPVGERPNTPPPLPERDEKGKGKEGEGENQSFGGTFVAHENVPKESPLDQERINIQFKVNPRKRAQNLVDSGFFDPNNPAISDKNSEQIEALNKDFNGVAGTNETLSSDELKNRLAEFLERNSSFGAIPEDLLVAALDLKFGNGDPSNDVAIQQVAKDTMRVYREKKRNNLSSLGSSSSSSSTDPLPPPLPPRLENIYEGVFKGSFVDSCKEAQKEHDLSEQKNIIVNGIKRFINSPSTASIVVESVKQQKEKKERLLKGNEAQEFMTNKMREYGIELNLDDVLQALKQEKEKKSVGFATPTPIRKEGVSALQSGGKPNSKRKSFVSPFLNEKDKNKGQEETIRNLLRGTGNTHNLTEYHEKRIKESSPEITNLLKREFSYLKDKEGFSPKSAKGKRELVKAASFAVSRVLDGQESVEGLAQAVNNEKVLTAVEKSTLNALNEIFPEGAGELNEKLAKEVSSSAAQQIQDECLRGEKSVAELRKVFEELGKDDFKLKSDNFDGKEINNGDIEKIVESVSSALEVVKKEYGKKGFDKAIVELSSKVGQGVVSSALEALSPPRSMGDSQRKEAANLLEKELVDTHSVGQKIARTVSDNIFDQPNKQQSLSGGKYISEIKEGTVDRLKNYFEGEDRRLNGDKGADKGKKQTRLKKDNPSAMPPRDSGEGSEKKGDSDSLAPLASSALSPSDLDRGDEGKGPYNAENFNKESRSDGKVEQETENENTGQGEVGDSFVGEIEEIEQRESETRSKTPTKEIEKKGKGKGKGKEKEPVVTITNLDSDDENSPPIGSRGGYNAEGEPKPEKFEIFSQPVPVQQQALPETVSSPSGVVKYVFDKKKGKYVVFSERQQDGGEKRGSSAGEKEGGKGDGYSIPTPPSSSPFGSSNNSSVESNGFPFGFGGSSGGAGNEQGSGGNPFALPEGLRPKSKPVNPLVVSGQKGEGGQGGLGNGFAGGSLPKGLRPSNNPFAESNGSPFGFVEPSGGNDGSQFGQGEEGALGDDFTPPAVQGLMGEGNELADELRRAREGGGNVGDENNPPAPASPGEGKGLPMPADDPGHGLIPDDDTAGVANNGNFFDRFLDWAKRGGGILANGEARKDNLEKPSKINTDLSAGNNQMAIGAVLLVAAIFAFALWWPLGLAALTAAAIYGGIGASKHYDGRKELKREVKKLDVHHKENSSINLDTKHNLELNQNEFVNREFGLLGNGQDVKTEFATSSAQQYGRDNDPEQREVFVPAENEGPHVSRLNAEKEADRFLEENGLSKPMRSGK